LVAVTFHPLFTLGKDIALVKADIDRAAEIEPREWTFYAFRAILECKRTEYAKALGTMAPCYVVLRRSEFKVSWRLDRNGGGHGKTWLEFFWLYEGEDNKANDKAKPFDLDHKFANMIAALWYSCLNSLKVN
jgi:hypothetical protein